MKKLKAKVKRQGICLNDCCVHGSPQALRQAFRQKRAHTVPRKYAKQYSYVKAALITINQARPVYT